MYVVSAFRRTNHGPAEAGHYVRANYGTSGIVSPLLVF